MGVAGNPTTTVPRPRFRHSRLKQLQRQAKHEYIGHRHHMLPYNTIIYGILSIKLQIILQYEVILILLSIYNSILLDFFCY